MSDGEIKRKYGQGTRVNTRTHTQAHLYRRTGSRITAIIRYNRSRKHVTMRRKIPTLTPPKKKQTKQQTTKQEASSFFLVFQTQNFPERLLQKQLTAAADWLRAEK